MSADFTDGRDRFVPPQLPNPNEELLRLLLIQKSVLDGLRAIDQAYLDDQPPMPIVRP
jgi:hypothetical protein